MTGTQQVTRREWRCLRQVGGREKILLMLGVTEVCYGHLRAAATDRAPMGATPS